MRRVVIDTNIALPALTGRGNATRLWALLAYGALHHRAREIDATASALDRLASAAPESRVGGPTSDSLRQRYVDAIASANEQFEIVVPSDLIMVTSNRLLDEYEAKLASRTVPGTPMTTEQIRECRFLVAVMSADMAILDESASPIVESDPDDDVVLRTAWELGAAVVVSDDKRHLLNRGGSPRIWTDPSTGRSAEVLSLNDFIHQHVNTSSFTLQDLDVDVAQVIPLLLGRLAGT